MKAIITTYEGLKLSIDDIGEDVGVILRQDSRLNPPLRAFKLVGGIIRTDSAPRQFYEVEPWFLFDSLGDDLDVNATRIFPWKGILEAKLAAVQSLIEDDESMHPDVRKEILKIIKD